MISRRNLMLTSAASLAAGSLLTDLALSDAPPADSYAPVETPNGAALAHNLIDGVKVFHLIAEPVKHEFAPGLTADCWGYNGRTPGPTIEAVEGDRVRIFVTNYLSEPTSVHWHGVFVPAGMDGVAGLSQVAIPSGETFKYEFTLRQHGTFMYHPHFDEMTQMAMGMMGMFIIHPRNPTAPQPQRDFAIMLSEWKIVPGTSRPDPLAMFDFNLFTMNSKVFPATAPLVVRQGQRVRIRLGNLSAMDHHPIHLHGYDFAVSGNDGQRDHTTLVPVGATRTIDFDAINPGDWALHCHMTHHAMNQMGHDSPSLIGVTDSRDAEQALRKALPGFMAMGHAGMGEMSHMHMPAPRNSIPMLGGAGPFGVIDMGGMFTILKVRENLTSYEDPGWYKHPAGTVASTANPDELRANQISVARAPSTTTALYVCPMHPDVQSKSPGNCPKCGMALQPGK